MLLEVFAADVGIGLKLPKRLAASTFSPKRSHAVVGFSQKLLNGSPGRRGAIAVGGVGGHVDVTVVRFGPAQKTQ